MSVDATVAPERTEAQAGITSIERCEQRIVVSFSGKVIADTRDALTLNETGYAPVLYVPRSDCDLAFFEKTAKSTYCPRKGNCSYFTVAVDGRRAENAAWSYEAPYPHVVAIRDHVAFYPDRVDVLKQNHA